MSYVFVAILRIIENKESGNLKARKDVIVGEENPEIFFVLINDKIVYFLNKI